MTVEYPLHPIAIKILKTLDGKDLSIYRLDKILNIPSSQIKHHVEQLLKYGFLIKKPNPKWKGYVYTINKKRVAFEHSSDKLVITLKIS